MSCVTSFSAEPTWHEAHSRARVSRFFVSIIPSS
jgi:hypothetical protein